VEFVCRKAFLAEPRSTRHQVGVEENEREGKKKKERRKGSKKERVDQK
jgi:hypothetical protein